VGQFATTSGEEGVHRCKPNFNTIWERHGAVVRKRNHDDILRRFCAMHERDRETNNWTDHETVTSIPIGEIDFQRCRLKTIDCRAIILTD